ncbi:group III truncated hemoglobin [Ferrovibrio sp.]|uniref:group III truncated hemoglobin n=1 Tax=Ferrovibrio sp. TaxID=1917215 RepID=UPI0025C138F4|nr:group III truncated hemoglobin [Ferrovibrio sp.]
MAHGIDDSGETEDPRPTREDRYAPHEDRHAARRREADARIEHRRQLSPGAPLGVDEALIASVVHSFYDRIRRDEMLGPIFARAIPGDWGPHLAKMVDFWSSVLLATGRYDGRPMPAHIKLDIAERDSRHEAIDEAHFQHWLRLFEATVTELCPAPAAALFMDRARRIAASFVMGIRFHRGETPDWLGPVRSA